MPPRVDCHLLSSFFFFTSFFLFYAIFFSPTRRLRTGKCLSPLIVPYAFADVRRGCALCYVKASRSSTLNLVRDSVLFWFLKTHRPMEIFGRNARQNQARDQKSQKSQKPERDMSIWGLFAFLPIWSFSLSFLRILGFGLEWLSF